ncbi:MAG: hypothetical protein AB203_02165 [Parcubacteria bacterium C7867-008]|nr:MAG: hypothetical protein AB203_02165 [Parcubacteria bacterium C7867-008]
MNPQEPLPYIQKELAAGATKETIEANLLTEGWSPEVIQQAFVTMQSLPTAPLSTVPAEIMPKPKEVRIFEWLLYVGFFFEFLASMSKYLVLVDTKDFASTGILFAAMPAGIWLVVQIAFASIAIRKKINWMRIVILILFMIGSVQTIVLFAQILMGGYAQRTIGGLGIVYPLLGIAAIAILGVAFLYGFSKTSNDWFRVAANVQLLVGGKNVLWKKGIPRLNLILLFISALLVFGLDLYILVSSGGGFSGFGGLLPFWLEMLAAFVVNAGFVLYENYKLAPGFEKTTSPLDNQIASLIFIRHIAVLLNSVPVIQLFGGAAIVFGGIPYLICYVIFVHKRNKITDAQNSLLTSPITNSAPAT